MINVGKGYEVKGIWSLLIAGVISLAGCASGGPKTVLIEGKVAPDQAATVHPIVVPGGLMLIRRVDGESTYSAAIGYFGSIYVPAGTHQFEVEVSHGFTVQDAGGPAWTVPAGVQSAPLKREGGIGTGLLVTKGVATVPGEVQRGKRYEMRFGFDRTAPENPIPVVWLSAIPGA